MTSSVCAASQKWNEARRQEVVRVCAARPLVASIEPCVVNYDEVFCDARGDLILREGGATQLRRASTTKAKVWLSALRVKPVGSEVRYQIFEAQWSYSRGSPCEQTRSPLNDQALSNSPSHVQLQILAYRN